jgi:hypothetical protein
MPAGCGGIADRGLGAFEKSLMPTDEIEEGGFAEWEL